MAKAIQVPWRPHAPYISGTARSEHDRLPFPKGRQIPTVESAELVRLLQSYGIPGADPSQGRSANLDRYSEHLAGIFNAAADQAEAAWVSLGVAAPGIDAHNGASTNQALRNSHIATVRTDAGNAAVGNWIRSKG